MNSTSKDATVNLLLLILFVLSATFIFFSLISFTFLSDEGITKVINEGFDTKSLFEKLSSKGLNTMQLLSQVMGLILPAFFLSKYKKSVGDYLEQKPFHLEFALLSFALFVFCYPLVSYLTYVNQNVPLPEWMSSKEGEMTDLIKQLLTMNNLVDLAVCIVAIAVIPAIAEEWIFRGILQNQFIRLFGNQWIGLILASIVFSSIHLQFEGFLPRLALGFVLGFVYLIGKSLKYSILLHFFFNGIQVFAVYFNGTNVDDINIKETIQTPSFYFALLASLFALYYFSQKILNFDKLKNV